MLYHYFGSKDGLFAAVLADQLESARDAPVDANLAERLVALQRHAAAHPESIRLLMWEALAYRDGEMTAGTSRIAAWRDRIAGIEAAQQGAGARRRRRGPAATDACRAGRCFRSRFRN